MYPSGPSGTSWRAAAPPNLNARFGEELEPSPTPDRAMTNFGVEFDKERNLERIHVSVRDRSSKYFEPPRELWQGLKPFRLDVVPVTRVANSKDDSLPELPYTMDDCTGSFQLEEYHPESQVTTQSPASGDLNTETIVLEGGDQPSGLSDGSKATTTEETALKEEDTIEMPGPEAFPGWLEYAKLAKKPKKRRPTLHTSKKSGTSNSTSVPLRDDSVASTRKGFSQYIDTVYEGDSLRQYMF